MARNQLVPLVAEPFRRDVSVYNEATGFLITSRTMGGRGIDSGEPAWDKAVAAGELLPLELVQDDSFIIRVRVGGALEEQEADEWVGRVSWKLRIRDGHLVVAGGSEFVMEPADQDAIGETEYVRILDVPAGDYRADVYAYLNGVNGEHLLALAAPPGKKAEPAGAYFRRTRRGEELPHWLRAWCVAYPDKDPGHEGEWDRASPEDGPEFVDFLLHLTPLAAEPGPPPKRHEGWISFDAYATRKPERCPVGLPARDVLAPPARPAPAPQPLRTVDVLARVADREPVSVAGGTVDLPLRQLGAAYRLAWFTTDSADLEIRLAAPAGSGPAITMENVELVAAEPIHGGWRIGFTSTEGKWLALRACHEVGARLAGLPDGTVVELMTAAQEAEGDPPLGLMRFRGNVAGGTWRIAEAFPPVTQERLAEAVALSRQCEGGTSLVLADADEAAEVRTRFLEEWEFLSKDNPLRQSGATLSFEKEDRSNVELLAAEAFRLRYADTWTMPEREEPFDLAGLFSKMAGVKGHDEGEVLLEGAGRTYRRYELRSLGDEASARADEADRTLAELGFTPLGDLVCSAFVDLAVRAYARPEGDTYGALVHGRFGQETFDFVTRFAKGAGLTTTLTPGTSDDTAAKNFKTSHPKADLAGLHAHHEKRKATLAGKYGPPVAVSAELQAFARAMEEGLAREL